MASVDHLRFSDEGVPRSYSLVAPEKVDLVPFFKTQFTQERLRYRNPCTVTLPDTRQA